MTATEITIRPPDYVADKAFLKDANLAYYLDALNETGEMPRGGLLLSDTMPNLICWGLRTRRRVGVFSLVGNTKDDGSPEVRVDTLYILPKFRRRGVAEAALLALMADVPYPVALRAPVHPALVKVAERIGITAHTEPLETAEKERRDLAVALDRMNQECVHGTACRPCLLRILTKINDMSWLQEEFKIMKMLLSR